MGISSGTSYTISWLQWADQPGAYWAIGIYAPRASDGAYNFYDGLSSGSDTGQIVPRKWERKSKTYTASSGYNFGANGSLYCYGQYTPAVYGTIKITDIQIETKGYRTPFVEGVPRTGYDAVRDTDPATNGQSGWRDLSGRGNHGTIVNALTGVAHYRDGNIIRLEGSDDSPYLDFDGTSDYIDVGDPGAALIGTSGTMCIWLHPDNIASGDAIWQKNDKSGGGTYVICKAYSTNRVQFGLYGDWGWSPSVYTDASDLFTNGNWHHLVCRWYPNGLDIWKDGNYHDSAVETGTWGGGASNTIWFGYNNSNDGTTSWDGKMAKIQLYNTALSHKQIRDIYNSDRSRFGK